MAKEKNPVVETETSEEAVITRIYEVGYHIVPSVDEANIEKVVGSIRSVIEKAGGSFIAEGAPVSTRLAYAMTRKEGEKKAEYDRGYFGWIKFESSVEAAQALEESLKTNPDLLRYIVFTTVREDTRAKMKAPQLREVKRTGTIMTAPHRVEEVSAPISEEQLEKALTDITTD